MHHVPSECGDNGAQLYVAFSISQIVLSGAHIKELVLP